MKLPNTTLYGGRGREDKTTIFLSFLNLDKLLKNSLQENWPTFDKLSGSKLSFERMADSFFKRRFHCRRRRRRRRGLSSLILDTTVLPW